MGAEVICYGITGKPFGQGYLQPPEISCFSKRQINKKVAPFCKDAT
jgi:hypothetical protein